MLTISFKSE